MATGTGSGSVGARGGDPGRDSPTGTDADDRPPAQSDTRPPAPPPPAEGGGVNSAGLWIGDEGLIAPSVAIGTVRDNLEEMTRGLAETLPEALLTAGSIPFGSTSIFGASASIFGDSEVQSAWAAFHRAWTRETGVTTSAVAQVAKLLPHSEHTHRGTDREGARETNRAGVDVPVAPPGPRPEGRTPGQSESGLPPVRGGGVAGD